MQNETTSSLNLFPIKDVGSSYSNLKNRDENTQILIMKSLKIF